MDERVRSLQAFALLVKAQQILISRLSRSEQGGQVPDQAPADEAGPDTIPEQHLVKVLQVCASAVSYNYLHPPVRVPLHRSCIRMYCWCLEGPAFLCLPSCDMNSFIYWLQSCLRGAVLCRPMRCPRPQHMLCLGWTTRPPCRPRALLCCCFPYPRTRHNRSMQLQLHQNRLASSAAREQPRAMTLRPAMRTDRSAAARPESARNLAPCVSFTQRRGS